MTGLLPLIIASLAMCSMSVGAPNIKKDLEKVIVQAKEPVEQAAVSALFSQCDTVKKLLGVSYENYDEKNEPDVEKLTIEYRDPNITTIYNISAAAALIPQSPQFNPAQDLYLFIPGFSDDPSNTPYTTISTALLSQGNSNVLALDASSLIGSLYLRSSTYVRFIGEKLGEVLAAMVDADLDQSRIHIIGHSLGAQIAAFTGKTFTNLTGLMVGRITGLDPAGPCFGNIDENLKLKATDGDYVDVIHTDAGINGLNEAVGQVDYYPNRGSEQPNCFTSSCSHARAWKYFAESVTNPNAFLSVKCKDYKAFKKGQCENDISPMGFASAPGTTGRYYLQTAGESPFGLGEAGLTWEESRVY